MADYQIIIDYQRQLEAQREKIKKNKSKMFKPYERCYSLIKEAGDYSFLYSLGYDNADSETLYSAASISSRCYIIVNTIFLPLASVIRRELERNPLAFYDGMGRYNTRVLSRKEVFELLQSFNEVTRNSIINKLTEESHLFDLLHESIWDNDFDSFSKVIDDNEIDTTAIGQALSFVQEFSSLEENMSNPEIIDKLSDFYDATGLEISFPSVGERPVGNVTKRNCIDRFKWYHQFFLLSFIQLFSYFNSLFLSSRQLSPSLRQLGYVVMNTEEFKEGSFCFAGLFPGQSQEVDINKVPVEEQVLDAPKLTALQPIRRPTVFRGQDGNQRAEKLYAFLINKGYMYSDKDNFFYLFGITTKRPKTGVKRIVWNRKKYELQAMLYVLYPMRKDAPKKTNRDEIFCTPKGERLNLSNTPLQVEKRANSKRDPFRASVEEDAIIIFKEIIK